MITYKVTVFSDVTKWELNDRLHREDGPAVEWTPGGKEWWLNGARHRVDGPAVVSTGGSKWWYLHGLLHREDGPAVEWHNGDKEWWLKGVSYTEAEFLAKTQPKTSCAGKVVEIDGKKYRLEELPSSVEKKLTGKEPAK